MSEEMIKAIAEVISGLHTQDTKTLKLITELIHSVSRIEERVTALEFANAGLHNMIYDLQTKVDALLDDKSDRIQ